MVTEDMFMTYGRSLTEVLKKRLKIIGGLGRSGEEK
jgi:hypothetical protein